MRTLKISLFVFILSITISAQWYQQNNGTGTSLYTVSFSDEDHGWAGGNSNTILRTTNGGTNWIVQTSSMYLEFISDIQSLNVNVGKAVVCGDLSSNVVGTTDGGINWWQLSSFNNWQFSLFFVNPNIGWTVGDYGTIYKTTNGGFNWVSQNSNSSATFRDVFFIDENIGIAVGQSGTIRRTTDGGQNWTTQISGTISYLLSVSFIDANSGWIATIDGTILRTTNGGIDWTLQSIGSTVSLRSICFKDLNNGTVVGLYGKIFKTTNGGVNWFEQSSGTTSNLQCVSFLDSLVGTTVGDNGIILHTMNGGTPVELTSFTAAFLENENSVELKWSTATETNNSGFEILRFTQNDEGWNKIGFVPGLGTTAETQHYSLTDNDVMLGKFQYKLKQIDYDGTFEYSQIVEVEVPFVNEFSLYQNYPNPFNPTTKIKYQIPLNPPLLKGESEAGGFVTLKVYDILGVEVATLVNEEKPAGEYEVEFDAAKLSSGIYFYKLQAGEFVSTKKMILLR
jgi:photosystem II stability/assembly factor-like uncharacterized protein